MNARRRRSGRRRRDHGTRRWRFDREGLMSLVAAVIFSGIGYAEISDLYLLKHRGEVVSATVLDESGGRNSHITVRYLTRAGQTVTGDTSNYFDGDVGETIQVVYDPEEPDRMQAADWGFDYWMPGVIFGIAIVVFLVFGLSQLWSRSR